jgi:hypothetical protein
MITSVYKGALGNQLFEVMTGYALALENSDDYHINPDFELVRGQGNSIKHYVDNIFKNFPKTDKQPNNHFVERCFRYAKIPYIEDLLLDGHFQSELYFKNYKKEINQILEFPDENIQTDDCVIHIRTGDFLELSDFNVVTPDYFKRCVDFVLDKNEKVQFKIVSDNNDLAKNYLPEYIKYQFVSNTELDDLITMSQADFVIMSNSTFSWWGSYLGKHKTTLVPDVWNNSNNDHSDIYRDDMIRIMVDSEKISHK